MKIVQRYKMNCPNCYRAGMLKGVWRIGLFHCEECGLMAIGTLHEGYPEELSGNETFIRREDDGDA